MNRSMQLSGVIETGKPFLVENNIKLRKTATIEGNIGKIIRVGTMNDEDFDYDIGSLISIDDVSLVIRSLKSGDLKAYDLNCTNSGLYKGTITV
jgi:hypothetical protein|tara:strand:- start:131 stop:412 length:282 start_codon:yes stop_codon:yes gene_type:complete